MAVVGTQVRVEEGPNHIVVVKRELLVDPERGIAVEVEKKIVAVDLGDGRIAVQEQQRLIGTALPARVS